MSEGNRFSRLAAPVVAGAACAACCAAPVAAAFAAIGLTTVAGFALFGAVALVLGSAAGAAVWWRRRARAAARGLPIDGRLASERATGLAGPPHEQLTNGSVPVAAPTRLPH